MNYFSSDHHFHHRNIQKFCPDTRAGETVEEMNQLLIEAHNSVVNSDDEVWFLGDFSFGTAEQTKSIISQLNGQLNLVYGNHDKVIRGDQSIQKMFKSVQEYKRISVGRQSIVLFHYPIMEWDSIHHGAYHLFGHVHGSLMSKPHGRSMDVGIDTRSNKDMKPWSFDEIDKILSERPILKHSCD
jgi:calcineurin-like phosphoesterase family protein